jgi:3-methylfumaryl-CoA hydratase
MSEKAAISAAEPDWREWIGKEESTRDSIGSERVAALAATLDLDDAPLPGDALPPGWHWLFFNPFVPRRGLGADGHPKRGGFLPPVPLPRRMWAGGRLAYPGKLAIGAEATRKSVIDKIEAKSGRAGRLVFVTVSHRISSTGVDCVVEQQDIVYREAAAPSASAPATTAAPENAQWTESVTPDTTMLFRYSALTFNGHRIHYDQTFAREEEHYPGLVVHGPLTATMLQNFARKIRPESRLEAFEFRGAHPLFVSTRFDLQAREADGDSNTLDLWARGPSGELAMRASARFAST